MNIKVCRTTDWSDKEWNSYVYGYNEVFGTSETVEFFKDKYLSVHKGYTLHSLLLNDEGEVEGGVSVIPCKYSCNGDYFLNGLAVDVFIRVAYREDPLMLRRLYKKLKTLLEDEGVQAVTAVPNATAYPYWKNVVKWKDVGDINYWIVLVRAGNVLGKMKYLLNAGSLIYTYLTYGLSAITSSLSSGQKRFPYSIDRKDNYVNHKFCNGQYEIVEKNAYHIAYSIVDEDGVKTAYIVDATKKGKRSAFAFRKAIGIVLKQKVDIIIYVGKMGIFQSLFIRVPKRFEPKRLPLMLDIITSNEQFDNAYDIKNWDFGILNYDVR